MALQRLARAIHQLSSRSKRPLMKVNCADLPGELIESEELEDRGQGQRFFHSGAAPSTLRSRIKKLGLKRP